MRRKCGGMRDTFEDFLMKKDINELIDDFFEDMHASLENRTV
jgi:hypothetical protein